MELQLQKQQLHCYEAVSDMTLTHEETGELIVPEYCPDISRIINTEGTLMLRGGEISDNKLTVTGAVRLSVLCAAEDSPVVRSLGFTLPFTLTSDAPALAGCTELSFDPSLSVAEAKLLNPRKLYARTEICVRVEGYRPMSLCLCTALDGCDELGVSLRSEQQSASFVTSVREREFSVCDEIVLSAGKEPIEELLLTRIHLMPTDTKLVSGKVIVKGLCSIEYLYRSTAQTLCTSSAEIGWSQVVEGAEEVEQMTCRLTSLRLCDVEIHTGSDSGMNDDARTLSLSLTGAVQLALFEEQNINFISDLYSTKYELVPKLENVALLGAPQSVTHRQNVREQLSFGIAVRSVLSASVCCGAVTVERTDESDMATLRTTAFLKVLYTDENGITLMAQRRCEIACPAEIRRSDSHTVRAQCCDEVTTVISADGVEVRFCVEFQATSASCTHKKIVTGAQIDTSAAKDSDGVPSLVLRQLREGECFWDLAKMYGSTVDDICHANGIAQESECGGAFLLIPRRRY